MRPFNMGLSTQNIHNRKDHTEFGKIPPLIEKNTEDNTATQKRENLQRNVWITGRIFRPYIS